MDNGIISEPTKLKERIRLLFTIVRASLAEELNGNHADQAAPPPNGNGGGAPAQQPVRRATQSQIKALLAIAKAKNRELTQLMKLRYRIAKPEDLTIQQASHLIDELKNGGG